ncbi:porin [Alphaproteobacteria bacterium]|nr:porin [Alphaproteobacteria bacterium]
MRKVLLATTALVAMSVTAAHADISISGNYEWEYTQRDTGDTWGDDGNVNIKATNAADNGMTFTAVLSLETSATTSADNNTGASYIQADGDFGTIVLGDYDDSAATAMDGALGRNNDIESQVGFGGADTALSGIGADIIYMSPSISGFKIGVSKDLTDADADADDGKTDLGITYSIGGASVYYGSQDDERNMGVKGTMAGFTIAVGNKSTSGTTQKANDIAVKYTLGNGMTVAAVSANGTTAAGLKVKASNVGASYAVVPGVKLGVESGKLDDANYTWIGVNMSF